MKSVKVAIDATPLLSFRTGIGNYTAKLIQTLRISNYPVDLNLFYGWKWSRDVKENAEPDIVAKVKRFKRCVPRAYYVASFVKQRVFNFGIKKFKPDMLHGPNYIAPDFEGTTVITIHDLSYLRFPETLPADRLAWLSNGLPRSIQEAVKVLTVSEFSKKEILSYFSVPEDKVVVAYNGIDSSYRLLEHRELLQHLEPLELKPDQYILSVGTLEPRKNLDTLIHAYSQLSAKIRERHPLVLAGLCGWKESSLLKIIDPLERKGQIRVLGYVSENHLPALYGGARAFVYPSFYEGFGMPLTESMACGTPVIASKCTSIPEVVGKAGILLNPYDVDKWSEAMTEIIENNEKCKFMKVRGLERASLFCWKETAKKTYQVYCQVRR